MSATDQSPRGRILRRVRQVILALWVASALGCVAMVGGAYLTDRQIMAEPQRALARVTSVGPLTTNVDFQDFEGALRNPPEGLKYPTGLEEGQRVWVTYQASNPDVVKVEGRTWRLSIIPALSVFVVATVIVAALWLAVGFAGRVVRGRWRSARTAAPGESSGAKTAAPGESSSA